MTGHLKKEISDQDHYIGPRDAPVTLLEYGDYQCPYSEEAHRIITKVMDRMNGHLRYVFRNYPLSAEHPLARSAAMAAEAADLQDKFWEMHVALFENQKRLSEEQIEELARGLELDMERFQQDWQERQSVADRVQEDFLNGERNGVNSTPSFFINGEKYDGPWDEESLLSALMSRLNSRASA